jgi:LemA protein
VSNGLLALVVLVAVAVAWAVSVFNRLVRSRNQMNNAFAQIDVQLKRRHDLIPNLVSTARGYLQHERQTLQNVSLARQRASEARQALAGSFGGAAKRAAPKSASSGASASVSHRMPGGRAGRVDLLEAVDRAEAGLNNALGKFAMVVEAYPELKADQTLMQLTEELTSTENRIAFSRQAFNDAVTSHNDTLGQFPASLVANACGFTMAGQLRSTTKVRERSPVMVNLP